MGPKLRIQRGESTSCRDLKTKGPVLYLDSEVERFTFHLACTERAGFYNSMCRARNQPF